MVVVKLTGRLSILKDTLSIYLLSAMKTADEMALPSLSGWLAERSGLNE
jgi:hypothetical protein